MTIIRPSPGAPACGRRSSTLALRPFRSAAEQGEFTLAALGGVQLSARPELWQQYAVARPQVLAAAKPVTQLRQRFPQHAAEIEAALQKSGHDAATAVWLPLIARKAEAWTVLLDASTAEVIGYLPLDSF